MDPCINAMLIPVSMAWEGLVILDETSYCGPVRPVRTLLADSLQKANWPGSEKARYRGIKPYP